MPDWENIAEKVHYGRGKEASVLGPPFDVYRVGASTSGNYMQSSTRLFQNVPMYYKPNDRNLRETLEGDKIPGVVLASLSLDVSEYQLKVGDVLLCVDPVLQDGHNKTTFQTDHINAWLLAQDSSPKLTIGVRLNQKCKIIKPPIEPTVSDAWEQISKVSRPVILSGGSFGIGTVGQEPAEIPIGMFPVIRPYGDRAFSEHPAMPRKAGWTGFLPPLKDLTVREGDRIHMLDGSRYQVVIAAKQETGLVGTYLFLEREVA